MDQALAIKESNGVQHAKCPNCSRMYALTDEKGEQQDVPSKCKRCGGPMDYEKAKTFADANAAKDHNPELTRIGNRIRGITQPPADTAIREPAAKK